MLRNSSLSDLLLIVQCRDRIYCDKVFFYCDEDFLLWKFLVLALEEKLLKHFKVVSYKICYYLSSEV